MAMPVINRSEFALIVLHSITEFTCMHIDYKTVT